MEAVVFLIPTRNDLATEVAMKLRKVHVREFKSVWDSNVFETDKVTCLVGKNEAGKTAILQALYRLNPLIESDGDFNVTYDYPRSHVEDYQEEIENGGRQEHAIVIQATLELEPPELEAIFREYGENILERPEVTLSKGYARNDKGDCALYVDLPIRESAIVRNFIEKFAIPIRLKEKLEHSSTLEMLSELLVDFAAEQAQAFADAQAEANNLEDDAAKAKALEQCKMLAESEQSKALRARLTELLEHKWLGGHIWQTLLERYFPKFLYFDEYYRLRGHDNVGALKQRQLERKLKPSDYPLLGLIQLARLDLDRLLAPDSTQDLKNKLEGASNHLSSKILPYWSQNKHLKMSFDVREGRQGDPAGMQSGPNIWGEVRDSKHQVSTALGTRSAGFVWFFSFLAWYSAEKKKNEPLVILLDEPGLSLHGRGQEDLLRYFEAEIVDSPKHQLIYTTHSPFMVDPRHFERVRIVQDRGIDSDVPLPRAEDGTKVFTNVLEAGPDSLFPLQGALGYEIHQTLFIGPNCLVVEGVSDLLYIQTISGVLESKGRAGLDRRWTITPVGGSDKVPTFVALIGSQKNLRIATLIDFQKGDRQKIENLYKSKLLKKSHLLPFTEFTKTAEADMEDMFDKDFYVEIVRLAYTTELSAKLEASDLTSRAPRILVRLDEYFSRNPLRREVQFNHYRPARFLADKVSTLTVPDATLNRFEMAFKAANALLDP